MILKGHLVSAPESWVLESLRNVQPRGNESAVNEAVDDHPFFSDQAKLACIVLKYRIRSPQQAVRFAKRGKPVASDLHRPCPTPQPEVAFAVVGQALKK